MLDCRIPTFSVGEKQNKQHKPTRLSMTEVIPVLTAIKKKHLFPRRSHISPREAVFF